MWGEPLPRWRKAQKRYQCQGEGCANVIAPGDRYLDKAVRKPANGHLRYCYECAGPILERAKGYHVFRGRNEFPDRYQQRIASAQWKELKRKIIEQRGSQCQRCGKMSTNLELHHLHYRSLGSESSEDVELLCRECHAGADEARAAKDCPKRNYPDEGLIVGPDGEYWGKFDPETVYIPLPDGRHVPVKWKARR